MATDLPTVSVIIPHFSDLEGLDTCLTALERQTYPAGRFDIIVGDNNSPEGIARVEAAARGRARVVLVEARGPGPARNGAVELATGEVLAFIDSDCVAQPGWLQEGVVALERYDFVGGHVGVLVDDEHDMTAVEAFERVFAFNFKTYIQKKGFTGAGNLFCPRVLFDAAGGFRTGLSEDVEWSRRAIAMGYRLGYAPRAVVGHPARRTWDELTRKWKRVNAETFGLSAGRRGRRLAWLVRTLALPVSAVAHTPRVLTSPQLFTVGQRLAAIAVLYRIRLWRMIDGFALLADPPAEPSPAALPSATRQAR